MVGCFESVDTMTDYPLPGGASVFTHKEMIERGGFFSHPESAVHVRKKINRRKSLLRS